MKKQNHLLLWLVLFPLLAIAAVYTVVSANQNFSTDIFLTYLSQVQPVWLAAAVGCTLCYIFWGRIEPAYHLPPLGQPLTPGARRRLVCSGCFLLCRHPFCNRWTAGLRLVHASGRCAGLCLLRSAASESGSLHPVHSGHRAHCHCTVPLGFWPPSAFRLAGSLWWGQFCSWLWPDCFFCFWSARAWWSGLRFGA